MKHFQDNDDLDQWEDELEATRFEARQRLETRKKQAWVTGPPSPKHTTIVHSELGEKRAKYHNSFYSLSRRMLRQDPDILCYDFHHDDMILDAYNRVLGESKYYENVYFILGLNDGYQEAKDLQYYSFHAGSTVNVIITQSSGNKAVPVDDVANIMRNYDVRFIKTQSVSEALLMALAQANQDDLIYLGITPEITKDAMDFFSNLRKATEYSE